MNDDYKNFWEVSTMPQAWGRIVLADHDDPLESSRNCQMILNEIEPKIKTGGMALEVGAGVGRLIRFMSEYFDFIWGVDHSEGMVALSADYLKDLKNCQIKLGDGYRLPVASNAFDFVYSFITFQHMVDLECVQANISEIYRVLKPGGMCRIQTIRGEPFRGKWGAGGFHGCQFEDENDFLKEFLDVGFDATVKVTPYQGEMIRIWVTGTKSSVTKLGRTPKIDVGG